MALLWSLWRNLLKLDLPWLVLELVILGLSITIRQCPIRLAMILSSCHPANCAFLLRVLPSLLKGRKLVPFFVTPVTWQLNSQVSSHYLEAVVYMFVSGTLQMSREGHADPSTKATYCLALINKSCPSVTFHSTLLQAHEKQTQRTGTKILMPRQFSQSAPMLSGEESWHLVSRRAGTLRRRVSRKDRHCIVKGSSCMERGSGIWTFPGGKNPFHHGLGVYDY